VGLEKKGPTNLKGLCIYVCTRITGKNTQIAQITIFDSTDCLILNKKPKLEPTATGEEANLSR